MMGSLYVTLGILLLLAVRNPAVHRSLIAFAAWSSFAHAAVMLVMALRDASERGHLALAMMLSLYVTLGIFLLQAGAQPITAMRPNMGN